MPNLFEHRLLKKIKSSLFYSEDVLCGIGDDGSVFLTPGERLCWVQDMMIEGTHFTTLDMDACSLGHKALAVNLSDLAAMAATPKFIQLSLALTSATKNEAWVEDFYRGMNDLAKKHHCFIVGGDLTSSDRTVIDVSVLGSVDQPVYRRNPQVKPGDQIIVSGTLGSARAGRALLNDKEFASSGSPDEKTLSECYQRPTPRLDLVSTLKSQALAAIDISDGLVSELEHLLAETEWGATLIATSIPQDRALTDWLSTQNAAESLGLSWALWGGEDYELLALIAQGDSVPDGFSVIGQIDDKPGIRLRTLESETLIDSQQGWDAFSQS